MTLLGLDLNASRARAVLGPAGSTPRGLPLDGTTRDLPALVSLQNRALEVGQPGSVLRRQLPHLVCENILSRLGTPHVWSAGRHKIDAARAVTAVLERVHSTCSSVKGLVLALPPYLGRTQAELLPLLAGKASLPLFGSVPASIALALSAYKNHAWSGLALLVDADDHALCFSVLAASPGENVPEERPKGGDSTADAPPAPSLTLIQTHVSVQPRLGILAWKMRLVDAVADRCVRHSRRDPRDSGSAEQLLFDQLDEVVDASLQEQMVEVVVQGAQWCQNLILRPEDVRAFCAPLARQALAGLREAGASAKPEEIKKVLVSEAAWRLPGLREALQEETGACTALAALPADAAALGAHDLAVHIQRGDLPRDHLDAVVRCPLSTAPVNPKVPERKRRIFRF